MSVPISYCSGEKNDNSIIFTEQCSLSGVLVNTDGGNNCTVTVYDAATANNSSKIIGKWVVVGNSSYGGRNYIFPVLAENGLYAEVSGGGTYFIEYIKNDMRG
jgi:hypothetical protein